MLISEKIAQNMVLLAQKLMYQMIVVCSAAKPHDIVRHPVEGGVHLSRQARRVLGTTGAVSASVPNLKKAAVEATRI